MYTLLIILLRARKIIYQYILPFLAQLSFSHPKLSGVRVLVVRDVNISETIFLSKTVWTYDFIFGQKHLCGCGTQVCSFCQNRVKGAWPQGVPKKPLKNLILRNRLATWPKIMPVTSLGAWVSSLFISSKSDQRGRVHMVAQKIKWKYT